MNIGSSFSSFLTGPFSFLTVVSIVNNSSFLIGSFLIGSLSSLTNAFDPPSNGSGGSFFSSSTSNGGSFFLLNSFLTSNAYLYFLYFSVKSSFKFNNYYSLYSLSEMFYYKLWCYPITLLNFCIFLSRALTP